jgi:hypothetical protein
MKASAPSLRSDRRGTALAEFALILPALLLLLFGVMEIGYLAWQFQQGAIASKRAVRIAATRALIVPGSIKDCGPTQPVTAVPGTRCSTIPDYSVWATCNGDGTGGAACGADIPRIAAEVADFYPAVEPENIQIIISGAGLGFVGMRRPVPLVTVRFVDVDYNFIALGGLADLTGLRMPDMSASATAEDLSNGPGT